MNHNNPSMGIGSLSFLSRLFLKKGFPGSQAVKNMGERDVKKKVPTVDKLTGEVRPQTLNKHINYVSIGPMPISGCN